MKVALVLFLCLVTVFSKVRYDGYKVFRLNIRNETEYTLAHSFSEELRLDVWAVNSIEGWMDIMVHPDSLDKVNNILPIQKEIKIEDVQSSIDESEQDRLLNGDAADFFSNFHTYSSIQTWATQQIQANPTKAEKFSIGKSYEGRDIFGVRLFKGASKKKIVIQCGIHAREWISPSSCCWMIDQLLTLSTHSLEWMIIPVLNVDGYEYTHSTERLWRKNRQRNTGSTCIGTDLNRNYGYGWSGPGASGNPCADTYYGSGPFSGTETKLIQNFLNTYINAGTLVSYFDIHAYGAMWMSPWGDKAALPKDYPVMRTVMQKATTAVAQVAKHTYALGSVFNVIYQASGGSNDWSYGDGGVIHSYAVEAFGNSFTPPVSTIPTIGAELYAGVLATANAI